MGGLISPEYLEMNKALHATGNYGLRGADRVKDVLYLAVTFEANSILDYGCGQGTLKKNMAFPVQEYDPAIKGKDSLPRPADLVVCTDVLEHIEPECLEAVLAHLKSLTKTACYVVVHIGAAKKILSDGRNAHLLQKPAMWWEEKLLKYFDLVEKQVVDNEAAFVLAVKRG